MSAKKNLDYYTVLGIQRSASSEQINHAYKNLAKKYHPDVPKGDEENFKILSEAYRILRDPRERERYDLSLQGSSKGYHGSPVQIIFDEQFSAYFLGVGIVYASIIFALFFMLDFLTFIAIATSITLYGLFFFIVIRRIMRGDNS
jgi:DnaJ-class molecular chaperone